MTESSVDVVVIPQNAVQSFATIPAASNSLPRLTVPAYKEYFDEEFHKMIKQLTTNGTCKRDDSSSSSCAVVFG